MRQPGFPCPILTMTNRYLIMYPENGAPCRRTKGKESPMKKAAFALVLLAALLLAVLATGTKAKKDA